MEEDRIERNKSYTLIIDFCGHNRRAGEARVAITLYDYSPSVDEDLLTFSNDELILMKESLQHMVYEVEGQIVRNKAYEPGE